MQKRLLLFFVAMLIGVATAVAQQTVKGTVISGDDGLPIVGAAVMKSEAEEETFKEGQRRNSIVSEHIESTKILSHSEF